MRPPRAAAGVRAVWTAMMKQPLSTNPTATPAFVAILFAVFFAAPEVTRAQNTSRPSPLAFAAADGGGFTFDTGVLRGKLRAGNRSIGVSSLIHVPTGIRLDRSQGILSHYRVFTVGERYGGGAWDWPSEAKRRADGSVEAHWPAADRPFEMWAVYRIASPATIEVETRVKALQDRRGFESFLASYFSERFTNALASVAGLPDRPRNARLMPVEKADGDWQMFPRDRKVLPLINDGRWQLEPNPVTWTLRPFLAGPLGVRRDPVSGLAALVMSPPDDCFAVAMPHQAEGHYSLYLSLFGRDLKAGETLRARTRLAIDVSPSDDDIFKRFAEFLKVQSTRTVSP